MIHVSEFPYPVKEVEHVEIPLPDGCRLAARIWMPEGADRRPVPAILEYIPYRKRDWTYPRDALTHPYLAGHGYAAVRVDLRGSGESDGVMKDEYLEQELEDGVEVLRWLSDQPWCDGNVGMMGISWGGFNGLQIAARQPPALKAVMTACSTDDRYRDDIHYMGGCMLGENLSWASVMFAYNTAPPDPALVGERWKRMWRERLAGSGLWLDKWLTHQRRDEYWKHGSVCEDYSRIRVPVFAVSGWADGYSNAVFRLLQNLDVPRLGLVGPWSHKYPHIGVPGPAIDFLGEMLRWWDYWLKGQETGIMKEPLLRAWMQESMPPATGYSERPGRWVAEDGWPAARIENQSFRLGPEHRLRGMNEKIAEKPMIVHSPLSLGLFSGKWCSESAPPDLPDDQREEDGGALVFDSHPLEEDMEILGSPEVHLELESDKPVAMLAVRLSNILPDRRITRVTYGMLNLTHREGHENVKPLEPGRRYRVSIRLNDVAQRFPRGHQFRIALSTSYWPHAWPSPEPATVRVYSGKSTLDMPVRPRRDAEDSAIRPFGAPIGAPPANIERMIPARHAWNVNRDLVTDTSTLRVEKDLGKIRFPEINWTVGSDSTEEYSVCHDDVNTVRGETRWERTFERDDWRVKTFTRTILTSDGKEFRIRATLDAYEGESRVHSESWDRRIGRHLV